MKFTTRQRNKIYRKAYIMIYNNDKEYVCHCFKDLLNNDSLMSNDFYKNLFPEFGLFDPKSNGCAWWYYNENHQRLTALAFMIAMTE